MQAPQRVPRTTADLNPERSHKPTAGTLETPVAYRVCQVLSTLYRRQYNVSLVGLTRAVRRATQQRRSRLLPPTHRLLKRADGAHRRVLVTGRFRVAHVFHDHADAWLLLVLRVLHPPLLRLRLALCSRWRSVPVRFSQPVAQCDMPREMKRVESHGDATNVSPHGGSKTEESPHMHCQPDKSAVSDGVEGQGAEEALWGQERIVTSVLEVGSRASGSRF